MCCVSGGSLMYRIKDGNSHGLLAEELTSFVAAQIYLTISNYGENCGEISAERDFRRFNLSNPVTNSGAPSSLSVSFA
jgi:hypothetical protein